MTKAQAKTLLILGGGQMQLPAITIAREKGWRVIVADANPEAPGASLAHHFENVDLTDREGMARMAREHQAGGGLDGVFTAGTDFSTTVAWVAERCGLPGIPFQAARAATDKHTMRERFREAGVACPDFVSLDAEEDPDTALESMSFPLVVKPVDNMGARGVRRVDDRNQLQEAVETALDQSASGQAIVEQYLEGPELSLDALIHEGEITICGVADRHICFPPYFVEMGHTMPSDLEPELLDQAEEVFRRGIRALGISGGAAKGDIKVTPAGAVVGEIAARLSGGYMSGWTYPFASGVEVTAGALNIAVGLPPGDLRPQRNWVSAERAFISIPGTVKSLEGLDRARSVPGIEQLFLRVSAGQQVALPINNMGKCGNLISKAPDRGQAVEAVEKAIRSVLVRLEPVDPRTDAFLLGTEQGGFSAFSGLCPATRKRLEQLPPWSGRPQRFSGRGEDLRIMELPGAGEERARDWHGWTLLQAFRRVLEICGGASAAVPADPDTTFILGRLFWNALIKGGVQAGVYVIDSLCAPESQPKYIVRKWMA